TMIEVPSDMDQINISICPGEKLVWILSPPFAHRVEELKSIWPNGEYQEHFNFKNDLMFISYLISGQNSSGK
ncbi:MAG: hypothetical protein KKB74_08230, partial [Bacteroidetes bacterium]|nr:hypothetical protein [Bacteroidota bacterium]